MVGDNPDLTDPPSTFGGYLRFLRERQGLSLLEVVQHSRSSAERIDKGALSRFENDQQRVPASQLVQLCRIYGAPVDEVMERLEHYLKRDRSSPTRNG